MVSVLLMLFFSAGVFLVPTSLVNSGMTASHTMTEMMIHRTNVITAVTQGWLNGAGSVLGNRPKNWLYDPSEVYTEFTFTVIGTSLVKTLSWSGLSPRSVNVRVMLPENVWVSARRSVWKLRVMMAMCLPSESPEG